MRLSVIVSCRHRQCYPWRKREEKRVRTQVFKVQENVGGHPGQAVIEKRQTRLTIRRSSFSSRHFDRSPHIAEAQAETGDTDCIILNKKEYSIKETYHLNILLKEWIFQCDGAYDIQMICSRQTWPQAKPVLNQTRYTSQTTQEEIAHTSRLAVLISRYFSVL